MCKKRKIFFLLTGLILLIIMLNKILTIDVLNYELEYEKEKLSIKQEKEGYNYFIKINHEDDIYTFDFYDLDSKNKKLIKDIYYYADNNYKCLLPIISDKVKVDMVCLFNNVYYNYHNIVGKNSKLDEFVKKINEYDISKFIDNKTSIYEVNGVKFYTKNIVDKMVTLTTYRGIINNLEEINLFKNDVYNNKLSIFIDKYYLVADYDNKHEFEYFYLINLENNNISKILSKEKISLDSYIQGVVDNKVYLYDKDNEVQYEIDVTEKDIDIVSTDTKIKYYKNNKWIYINKLKANKELLFDYNDLSNIYDSYDHVIKTDRYYYLFKKDGKNYDLYRVDIDNENTIKYITKLETLDIYHKENFIYFIIDNKLYYYSDEAGLKTLIEYDELKFNNTIKVNIY